MLERWELMLVLRRTCGEYIYKGKKFNARKETVDGEEYYGIKVGSSVPCLCA